MVLLQVKVPQISPIKKSFLCDSFTVLFFCPKSRLLLISHVLTHPVPVWQIVLDRLELVSAVFTAANTRLTRSFLDEKMTMIMTMTHPNEVSTPVNLVPRTRTGGVVTP